MVWRANYNIGVLFYGFGLLGLVHLFQVFKIIFSTFQAIKPNTENIMVIISQCSHLVSRRTGAAMIANNNNPLCVKLQVMRNPVRADESSHQAHNTLYNAGCDTQDWHHRHREKYQVFRVFLFHARAFFPAVKYDKSWTQKRKQFTLN